MMLPPTLTVQGVLALQPHLGQLLELLPHLLHSGSTLVCQSLVIALAPLEGAPLAVAANHAALHKLVQVGD